ncbi:MAG: radical SAM protein [Nitrospirae bacterium]|nr:radical SAM protein [Nitrospirota bacterium]
MSKSMHDFSNYIKLLQTGELCRRAEAADNLLKDCALCPRECGVDRTKDELGFCGSGYLPIVASCCVHHGEEPVLSGAKGSGTIFFGNCNLRCVFCQNHQISQPVQSLKKNEVSFERLADIMLELQAKGCHNINLVSPTHFFAQIIKAIAIAASKGLKIPLVYNTNAYDSLQALRLLDGIIDIYLPDIKYSDDNEAKEYSKAKEYVKHSRQAITEMKRQVGSLVVDDGIAVSGLIIRHLVLPNEIAGSGDSLRFIKDEIGKETFISVMSQYFPTNRAGQFPLLSRPIRPSEYEKVLELLDELGLDNGWVQECSSKDYYCPDFEKEQPFAEKGFPTK